jgi:hypothetical protein
MDVLLESHFAMATEIPRKGITGNPALYAPRCKEFEVKDGLGEHLIFVDDGGFTVGAGYGPLMFNRNDCVCALECVYAFIGRSAAKIL